MFLLLLWSFCSTFMSFFSEGGGALDGQKGCGGKKRRKKMRKEPMQTCRETVFNQFLAQTRDVLRLLRANTGLVAVVHYPGSWGFPEHTLDISVMLSAERQGRSAGRFHSSHCCFQRWPVRVGRSVTSWQETRGLNEQFRFWLWFMASSHKLWLSSQGGVLLFSIHWANCLFFFIWQYNWHLEQINLHHPSQDVKILHNME